MNTILRPGQQPLVSIIIPVFNKCDLTLQCLQALAGVTNHIPHEIIVVDNASSDETPQRMKQQPSHIRYLRNETNRNFAGACNQGAAAAAGKHLLFLNNDTIPVRGWLDALLEEIRLHPKVALVGSRLLYESGQIQHAGVIFSRETRNPFHPYRLLRMDDPRVNRRRELQAVTAACFLVQPKWFRECGGFSEAFLNGYEDLDLCLRIRQRGGVIVYQPKSVVFHLESQTPGRMTFDNQNRALFFQRWNRAVLSDEDAYYFADGCYKLTFPGQTPEPKQFIRFADDAERAQWQRVALSQTLAARWQRAELVQALTDADAWPQEAAVRRWAGCLAQRLGLPAVAQRHFAAALALQEDEHVRLLSTAPQPEPAPDLPSAPLRDGFEALRQGKFIEAGQAFELALFRGDSPNLALTGLWRATAQTGAAADAQLTRQALQNLGRLNPETARQLAVDSAPLEAALPVLPATKLVVPQVSIIIPVFNRLALTRGCLDSLAKTSAGSSFEIIVVDNASSDGTAEFLKDEAAAGRLRAVTNSKNGGFSQACNLGAQAAHGSLVLFLNNDTQVTSGWLDALVSAAQKPRVGVVGAKLLYADGSIQHAGIEFINGIPDHPHRHAPGDFAAANQPRELDMVTGACFMMPRELFLQLAGFDEVYRNGVEDVDLCLRARTAGYQVLYEPKSVVYHLEGQSEGRFNHVNENLKTFFARWAGAFGKDTRLIVPTPPRFKRASQSSVIALPHGGPASPGAQTDIVVCWQGSFLDHGSLSHVNRELVGPLKSCPGLQITCVTNGGPVAPDAATAWPTFAHEISATPDANAQITVRHAWPPNWQRPAQGKLVVIQPWEFGTLPRDWVQWSRQVDEFWLPSEYVRRVYIDSGVPASKVVLVPNGVDPEKFHPQVAPLKLASSKTFKFLFVGGTIGRKGPDLLLQAYLMNFTAADDVCLVIKDFGGKSVYTGLTFEAGIRAAQARPNAPEILYLNEELPPDSLPALYTACQCLVLPYRGEGFGLPVLEAMACGRPVIVTAGGATDDFVRDEFAYRIPAVKKVFGREVSGSPLAGNGWLLEPDVDALGQSMRRVFEHPAEAAQRGQLACEYAQQHCTWKQSAAIVAQRLRALSATAAPAQPGASLPPAKLPTVALIGQLAEARELFGRKNLAGAWQAANEAINRRPFHPEALLLLAEIALGAGAGKTARCCAQRARELAPAWAAPRQFLARPMKGDAKPAWLQSASLTPRPAPRLSICLIVKNEERFLVQCLQSVRALAAQIIVVDTGSTDRTVEIAREFGAEIHSFAWCDDFAAARNAALEHATGDWILMLDADEELPTAQHSRLQADLKHASTIAFRLPLINVGYETEGRSFVPRLFRNAPGAFFRGRIHEQIFSSLLDRAESWGLKTAFGSAEILHHGYAKDLVQDRNKIERNLKLLRTAVAEDPTDANLVMNLGMELVRSDDLPGGIERYREAYQLMSAQPPRKLVPELREVLLTQFTSQLYKIRAHDEVVQVLTSPLARHCELTASLHFALGLSHFELKQFREAADQMRQCLAQRQQACLTPINTDIRTAAPQHCLALCLAQLGDLPGAEKAFAGALTATGETEQARLDYARFLRTQTRFVEALQQLHTLVQTHPRLAEAWQLGGEIALSRPDFLEFALEWTAEAIKALPENPLVAAQRAEALMLNDRAPEAALLWEKLWCSEHEPRTLAALILCESATGSGRHLPAQGPDEQATSVAFVQWYQRLIAVRAKPMLGKINGKLEPLSQVLPTAAQMLQNALAEAEAPVSTTMG